MSQLPEWHMWCKTRLNAAYDRASSHLHSGMHSLLSWHLPSAPSSDKPRSSVCLCNGCQLNVLHHGG